MKLKKMKKISLLLTYILVSSLFLQAQDLDDFLFFKEDGSINYNEELSHDLGYTLVHLDSRADDVVWAHIVYKIIDLRDNQNSQLAYPVERDARHKNLFRVIAEAVTKNAKIYYPSESDITPNFDSSNAVETARLSDAFFIETYVGGAQYIDPLFFVDTISNDITINNRIYDRFANRVNKFMIQQVFYFDKHLSQMKSKIIGIAPLMRSEDLEFDDFSFLEEDTLDEEGINLQDLKTTLRESILCWFLYDDIKPILSTQLIFQESNIAQRMTYHEFFTKKMFSAYLIGDNNSVKQLYYNTSKITPEQLLVNIESIQRKLVEIESNLFQK